MGFFDLFKAKSSDPVPREEPQLQASSNSDAYSGSQWKGLLAVGGAGTIAGARVTEETVIGLPATLQALRILTGVFAMTPLHYYRRGEKGRERVENDLQRLLHDRPNNVQTAFQYRELMKGDILLAGEHYAYVSLGPDGRPRALTRLIPGSVTVSRFFDRSEGDTLFYDATLPDGTRERFPRRHILHIAGFSRDGIQGLNPVRYMREALGGALATGKHANAFWESGGKLDTILKTKNRIGPEDKNRIRSDWEALHNRPGGSRTAILDQDLTAEILSPNHKDSQFLETRQFQVVDLARIWGVPPHLIFDLTRSTFSNIEHQSLEFAIYHLGPHFARVEQAMTRQFAEAGHYFEHLTDALVRGDIKTRMEAYWLQRQMGMANANELRGRENQPDIDGAAGTEYWRPGNMSIAGEPAAPQQPVRVNTGD